MRDRHRLICAHAASIALLVEAACGQGPVASLAAPDASVDCSDPTSTGCPCDAREPIACYEGAPGTIGVGICRAGARNCTSAGIWSPCVGQIRPRDELRNGLDDDCDGEIDEVVGGGCDDLCGGLCQDVALGGGDVGWGIEEGEAVGVEPAGEGCIALTDRSSDLHLIWIANSIEGTISKVDTREKTELARYRTGPLGSSSCYWCGPGDNPSRTSVSSDGDAYVANRAFGGQGSATRIDADDCVDRDGDGVIETSTDGEDVRDWGEDECVAWNVPVGPSLGLPRAIVLDERIDFDGSRDDRVWVGIFDEMRFHELDAETGEPTGATASLSPATPYGAAIDRDGVVWVATLTNLLAWFDTRDPEDGGSVSMPPGYWNYGITVDAEGDVWLSGVGVLRYRPDDGEWDSAGAFASKGIAATPDGPLFTHDDSGTIGRVDPWEMRVDPIAGKYGRGVAVDSDGIVWFINWDQPGGDDDGDVSLLDPAGIEDPLQSCCAFLNRPYTYSDMTGTQRWYATRPEGWHAGVVPPCEGNAEAGLVSLEWTADLPEETGLRFEARGATSLPALADVEWAVVAHAPDDVSPVDVGERIDPVPGGVFEVRVVLESEHREVSPMLCSWGVLRRCDACLR